MSSRAFIAALGCFAGMILCACVGNETAALAYGIAFLLIYGLAPERR